MTDYTELIARLRSHVSPAWGSALPAMHEAADAIAALVAERDAAVADAQRYRWLRDGNNYVDVMEDFGAECTSLFRGERLDAAIDAFRQPAAPSVE